jgi:5-methylcytosine-specific restriction endonuclease McrA
VSAPSDSEQLTFLGKIQRLLEEGQFTATYKFALLVALVDIAIEQSEDDGRPVRIPLLVVAEKFAEYYWGHTRPYAGKAVLSQNKGRNITALSILERVQKQGRSLAEARRRPEWRSVLNEMARLVVTMPLFKLQTLRSGGKLVFLYDERIEDGALMLLSGVAFCLRRFAGLIRTMARHGWLAEIRRNPNNAYLIDDGVNLEEFLFGDERVPLGKVREVLQPMQSSLCFYCEAPMGATIHVDHFVPFVLYPGNLAHNLVLAHASCNTDKSHLLADIPYLERWLERNDRFGEEIGKALAKRGIVGDLEATRGIAHWAYKRAQEHGSLLWIRRRETRPFPTAVTLPL